MLINRPYENCYEELLRYYPRFYRDVYEMREILKAEGGIADQLEASAEQVFSNAFLDTADETTIAKLESFLDIKLRKAGTPEERRRMVKSFFVGAGKTSSSMIKEMIHAYTNADVTVKFEPADTTGNNKLYIEFERGSEKEVYLDDMQTLLAMKIPAHIDFAVNMTYAAEATAYHAFTVQTGTTITLETEAI